MKPSNTTGYDLYSWSVTIMQRQVLPWQLYLGNSDSFLCVAKEFCKQNKKKKTTEYFNSSDKIL